MEDARLAVDVDELLKADEEVAVPDALKVLVLEDVLESDRLLHDVAVLDALAVERLVPVALPVLVAQLVDVGDPVAVLEEEPLDTALALLVALEVPQLLLVALLVAVPLSDDALEAEDVAELVDVSVATLEDVDVDVLVLELVDVSVATTLGLSETDSVEELHTDSVGEPLCDVVMHCDSDAEPLSDAKLALARCVPLMEFSGDSVMKADKDADSDARAVGSDCVGVELPHAVKLAEDVAVLLEVALALDVLVALPVLVAQLVDVEDPVAVLEEELLDTDVALLVALEVPQLLLLALPVLVAVVLDDREFVLVDVLVEDPVLLEVDEPLTLEHCVGDEVPAELGLVLEQTESDCELEALGVALSVSGGPQSN